MNFYQFYDRLNGKPYTNSPAPVKYTLGNYLDSLTSSPVNGGEEGTYELRPLSQEDMARYAAEDVIAYYQKHGKKPGLGKPMTDSEFRRFLGL